MQKTKRGWYGLEYVEVTLPCDEKGNVHASAVDRVAHSVAREIIRRNVPLRGKELRYLRRLAGLSYKTMAEMLGIRSASTIQNWEDKPKKLLEPVIAFAVRDVMAGVFGVQINGHLVDVRRAEPPTEFEVDAKFG